MLHFKILIVMIGLILIASKSVYSCECSAANKGDEICASNGRTYESDCHFSCEKDTYSKCLTKVSDGECTSPECICDDPCNFVCGSDGHSYGNYCLFKCAQRNDPSLVLVKDGPCFECNTGNGMNNFNNRALYPKDRESSEDKMPRRYEIYESDDIEIPDDF